MKQGVTTVGDCPVLCAVTKRPVHQKEVLVAKRVESFAYFLTHLDLTLEMRTAMDKT
jgi:hypothetical protein